VGCSGCSMRSWRWFEKVEGMVFWVSTSSDIDCYAAHLCLMLFVSPSPSSLISVWTCGAAVSDESGESFVCPCRLLLLTCFNWRPISVTASVKRAEWRAGGVQAEGKCSASESKWPTLSGC